MAMKFGNLIFVHMPFTGGTWFGRQLSKIARGVVVSPMHDLPASEHIPKREVMTTRPIWDWYRSAHGYMSPNWRCAGTDSHMWNVISARLVQCADDDFDQFMRNVFITYPGLFSWAFSMYAVPKIEIVHLFDAESWLEKNYQIEVNNEPFNQHANPNTVITDQIKATVMLMEDQRVLALTRTAFEFPGGEV
jgi:hypothetical protein